MAQNRKQAAEAGQRFRKDELLRAERLKKYRDLAGALLEPGAEYTLQEAEDHINQFLKGKVK